MEEFRGYWEQYLKYFQIAKGWYGSQALIFQRFIKYGGWIAIQFWVIRAPMTVFFTNAFPEQIDFLIKFPGYLLASFTSGSILAIIGFFLSEWWIWRKPKDAD